MDKQQLLKTNFFTEEEWDLTPPRVKDLVVRQKLKIEELEKELEELKKTQENLQEKVNCNSQNSSIPPSSEIIKPEKKERQKRKRRKRGGQKGHIGYSRELYPESECTRIEDHKPETGKCCGEKLSGIDANPDRHQVVEIPPIQLEIAEHRLHQLECNHCGAKTRAKLPAWEKSQRKKSMVMGSSNAIDYLLSSYFIPLHERRNGFVGRKFCRDSQ